MGRRNKNARSRSHGHQIHANKYIGKIGQTKQKGKAQNTPDCGTAQIKEPKTTVQTHTAAQIRQETHKPECMTTRPSAIGPIPRRYEIWFAELGDHYGTSVQSGIRPVLVISNDVGNQYSQTLTVLPMTTKFKKMEMPTHTVITGDDCCMFRPEALQDSILLAEQITTIDKAALRSRLCRVTSKEKWREIEQAVVAQLGMAAQLDMNAQLDMMEKCGDDSSAITPKSEEDEAW